MDGGEERAAGDPFSVSRLVVSKRTIPYQLYFILRVPELAVEADKREGSDEVAIIM